MNVEEEASRQLLKLVHARTDRVLERVDLQRKRAKKKTSNLVRQVGSSARVPELCVDYVCGADE